MTRVDGGPGWEIRLGDWRDVLGDIKECDAVITDPPYSSRTHEGQRTGSSVRKPTISYDSISQVDSRCIAEFWSEKSSSWVVMFCDHTAFNWHDSAWSDAGWLVFAPLLVKQNPPPRFSGDGPAFGLEFIMAARKRSGSIKPGSLPAYYETDVGGDRHSRTIAGVKNINVMRAIIRDYTKPGDLVVDPFCGTGTTALACVIEGRRCITSEIDPATYEIALSRLRKGYTPQINWGDK